MTTRTSVLGTACAVLGVLLSLTGPVARGAVALDCAGGPVLLGDDGQDYVLTGSCSNVTITAHHVTVTLPDAAHLDVRGSHVTVRATGPITAITVSAPVVKVRTPRSRSVSISASRIRLRIDRLNSLKIEGDHVTAIVTHGSIATLRGTGSSVRYDALDTLVVKGSNNSAIVRHGRTHVTSHGAHNSLSVHTRLQP